MAFWRKMVCQRRILRIFQGAVFKEFSILSCHITGNSRCGVIQTVITDMSGGPQDIKFLADFLLTAEIAGGLSAGAQKKDK